MISELFKLEHLLAKTARFRSTFADLFMLTELNFLGRKCAELALYGHVFSRFVLFLFIFGDDLAALSAFVILARTLDLVHPKLGRIDHAFAVAAFLLLHLFFNHIINF
jgi:hypothetical protein